VETGPSEGLSKEDVDFLSKYLHPTYLQPSSLLQAAESFASESTISLHDFLCDGIASKVEAALRRSDEVSGYTSEAQKRPALHSSGLEHPWSVKGPPHKKRYCVLDRKIQNELTQSPDNATGQGILEALQNELFPSAPFRSWLTCVTSLIPRRFHVEVRRFRPGLDYTLATSEEKEARLDVVLSLTPSRPDALWEECVWGGWEVRHTYVIYFGKGYKYA
jgi:hypothetical protein